MRIKLSLSGLGQLSYLGAVTPFYKPVVKNLGELFENILKLNLYTHFISYFFIFDRWLRVQLVLRF